METAETRFPPCRVTDLIAFKQGGLEVACQVSFEIIPVDFLHRANPFQAYVFLARYTGDIDGREYQFRKCYARGCPHNLCPHVSQAVMIANRHLQRDYHRLEDAGIELEKRLFSLSDMMVKYESVHQGFKTLLTISDYISLAREGLGVSLETTLEYVPAVEHFAGHQNAQMFLMAAFSITSASKKAYLERCLACYPKENEGQEKQEKTDLANERLKLLYQEFEAASIKFERKYFS